ncbi:MAG: tyrosine-protein kinase family protein [Candidatus Angelobacter sp.]
MGRIITFYSYKGGTGRSMLLANVAWILASQGKRVLAIDWDLEAPGLHRYFSPFLTDKELSSSPGLIDFLSEYVISAYNLLKEEQKPPSDWYVQFANLLSVGMPLNWYFPDPGCIDFVPAGKQDTSYAARVNLFDWQSFYDNFGGGLLLEEIKARLTKPGQYDYVLIDSRTGVSDTSGICTIQMPDALVVCFTYNNQSILGASDVARTVALRRRERSQKSSDASQKEPAVRPDTLPFRIFPVPTRVESGEKDRVRVASEEAFATFEAHLSWLDVLENNRRPSGEGLQSNAKKKYWLNVGLPYLPFYSLEEVLAPFADQHGDPKELLAAAERLTAYLTDGDVTQCEPIPEEQRKAVLQKFLRSPRMVKLAEEAFAGLGEGEQKVAKTLLLRLVRVSEDINAAPDTCQSVLRSDIDSAATGVLNKLIAANLIESKTDGNGQVGFVADPSIGSDSVTLIKSWPRLSTWINADREFLAWRQTLQKPLVDWEKSQDVEDLLAGSVLSDASRWIGERRDDLNRREKKFIQTSIEKFNAIKDKAERVASQVVALRTQEYDLKIQQVTSSAGKLKRGFRITVILLLMLTSALGGAVAYFVYERRDQHQIQVMLDEAPLQAAGADRLIGIEPVTGWLKVLVLSGRASDAAKAVTKLSSPELRTIAYADMAAAAAALAEKTGGSKGQAMEWLALAEKTPLPDSAGALVALAKARWQFHDETQAREWLSRAVWAATEGRRPGVDKSQDLLKIAFVYEGWGEYAIKRALIAKAILAQTEIPPNAGPYFTPISQIPTMVLTLIRNGYIPEAQKVALGIKDPAVSAGLLLMVGEAMGPQDPAQALALLQQAGAEIEHLSDANQRRSLHVDLAGALGSLGKVDEGKAVLPADAQNMAKSDAELAFKLTASLAKLGEYQRAMEVAMTFYDPASSVQWTAGVAEAAAAKLSVDDAMKWAEKVTDPGSRALILGYLADRLIVQNQIARAGEVVQDAADAAETATAEDQRGVCRWSSIAEVQAKLGKLREARISAEKCKSDVARLDTFTAIFAMLAIRQNQGIKDLIPTSVVSVELPSQPGALNAWFRERW